MTLASEMQHCFLVLIYIFPLLLGEEDGVLLYFGPGAVRCHPEMHVYLSRYYIGRTNA